MAFDLTGINDWIDERADKFFFRAVLTGVTAANSNVMTGMKSETKIPDLELLTDGILQDGSSCVTTDVGTMNIRQRSIDPKQFKILIKFCMTDLERKFINRILPAGSTYEGLAPLEQQFMFEIERRIRRVVEFNLWKGVEGGANADASLNLMDGLDEIISDEIVAATIPAGQQTSVAEDAANIVAAYDGMRKALPIDQFSDVNESGENQYILLTDPNSKRLYEEAYRATFTALPFNMEFRKDFIDGTSIQIVGTPGLFGESKSLMIKRAELLLGVDVEGEETSLTIDQGAGNDIDNVYVNGRFKMAPQIHFPGQIVTNNY